MRKEIKLTKLNWIPKGVFTVACKVYHDGTHFVGVPIIPKAWPTRPKSGTNGLSNETKFFDEKYGDLLTTIGKPTARNMFMPLRAAVLSEFPKLENVDDFIVNNIKRQRHNFFSRLKRFKRKAHLNKWNKFVTITYDPNKHDEFTFRKKLKRCLSNLHTRRGWSYMGVFERAPETNRLHFHAIMNIPDGEMVGTVSVRRDWSTAQHVMQVTHSNDFFERRFGRNDFEDITEIDLLSGRTLDYLVKYLGKTNERITYSRGIPSEILAYVERRDIVCSYIDFVTKCVLFDDCADKDFGYVPSKTLKYGQWSIDDYMKNSA